MRNLQKILALVLALIMSFSLVATAGAFSDDGDISDSYKTAVNVLNGLEVFKGYDNGATFQPKGNITRAEVAAIIYRIATGDVTDSQASIYSTYGQFTDVADGSWYAGYVNYCANAGYIKGRGNKIFDPQGQVTGYEALAMILRAVGYDKNGEFTGSNWQIRTASIANQRGITKNVTEGMLGQAATRETVAEILFRAILVNQVDFSANTLSYTEKATSLGYDSLKLEEIEGVITANEYADLNEDDTLPDGRTEMLVDGKDYTIDYTTTLDDIGESHIAYIQNGKKVLAINDREEGNVTAESTAKIKDEDALKAFAKENSISLDKSAERYLNFSKGYRWMSDWRIRYEINFVSTFGANTTNDFNAAEAEYERERATYKWTVGLDEFKKSDGSYNVKQLSNGKYLWIYEASFKAGDEIGSDHQSNIQSIFDYADRFVEVKDQDTRDAYTYGEVYAGTSSLKDLSDSMSYNQFVTEYINQDTEATINDNENGNWVKIIDNDKDGVADYVLKVIYTTAQVDKVSDSAVTLDTKDIDFGSDEDNINEITSQKVVSADTLAVNDIVYYAVIDGKAQTYKATPVTAKIDKVNRNDLTATTADGTVYTQSGVCEHVYNPDYTPDVRGMADGVSYDMYLGRGDYMLVFVKSVAKSFTLLVDGYYNSTSKDDQYAVKAYQDGRINNVDVGRDGDLFIGKDGLNNGWGNIRPMGGTGNLSINAKDGDQTFLKTAVAGLDENGNLIPVDFASVYERGSHAMISIPKPVRSATQETYYTGIFKDGATDGYAYATSKTAYDTPVVPVGAADNKVEIRALSSTVYYFVWKENNAYHVKEYVGYGAVPSLSVEELKTVEDIYAVGTRHERVSTSGDRDRYYYTADVVVVELNKAYKKSAEQIFVADSPIVGNGVRIDTLTVIRNNGVKEDIQVDLTKSILTYDVNYDEAGYKKVLPGVYNLYPTSEEGIYTIEYMNRNKIVSEGLSFMIGNVNTKQYTADSNYVGIDTMVTGGAKTYQSNGEFQKKLTADTKYYTLDYEPEVKNAAYDRQNAHLDESTLSTVLKPRVEESKFIKDNFVYDLDREFDWQDRYGCYNNVLVCYDGSEAVYVVSFQNYDDDMPAARYGDHWELDAAGNRVGGYTDYAQHVWESMIPDVAVKPGTQYPDVELRAKDGAKELIVELMSEQEAGTQGFVNRIPYSVWSKFAGRIDELYITPEANHSVSVDGKLSWTNQSSAFRTDEVNVPAKSEQAATPYSFRVVNQVSSGNTQVLDYTYSFVAANHDKQLTANASTSGVTINGNNISLTGNINLRTLFGEVVKVPLGAEATWTFTINGSGKQCSVVVKGTENGNEIVSGLPQQNEADSISVISGLAVSVIPECKDFECADSAAMSYTVTTDGTTPPVPGEVKLNLTSPTIYTDKQTQKTYNAKITVNAADWKYENGTLTIKIPDNQVAFEDANGGTPVSLESATVTRLIVKGADGKFTSYNKNADGSFTVPVAAENDIITVIADIDVVEKPDEGSTPTPNPDPTPDPNPDPDPTPDDPSKPEDKPTGDGQGTVGGDSGVGDVIIPDDAGDLFPKNSRARVVEGDYQYAGFVVKADYEMSNIGGLNVVVDMENVLNHVDTPEILGKLHLTVEDLKGGTAYLVRYQVNWMIGFQDGVTTYRVSMSTTFTGEVDTATVTVGEGVTVDSYKVGNKDTVTSITPDADGKFTITNPKSTSAPNVVLTASVAEGKKLQYKIGTDGAWTDSADGTVTFPLLDGATVELKAVEETVVETGKLTVKAVAADEELLGDKKLALAIQADVNVTPSADGKTFAVTGTSKYVSSWGAWSSGAKGYFVALEITHSDEGPENIGIVGSDGDVKYLDDIKDGKAILVWKITPTADLKGNTITVKVQRETYTIDLSGMILGKEDADLSVQAVASGSIEEAAFSHLGKTVNDLQSNITLDPLSGGTIKVHGTSKYVGSGDEAWNNFWGTGFETGYYIALKLTYPGATNAGDIQFASVDGTGGSAAPHPGQWKNLDTDGVLLWKLTLNDAGRPSKNLYVKVNEKIYTLDLSDVKAGANDLSVIAADSTLTLYGKKVTELQNDDVTASEPVNGVIKVTGTAKYVTGYTGAYTGDNANGWFIALDMACTGVKPEKIAIFKDGNWNTELSEVKEGETVTCPAGVLVCRINTNKSASERYVLVRAAGKDYTVDLSGVVLEDATGTSASLEVQPVSGGMTIFEAGMAKKVSTLQTGVEVDPDTLAVTGTLHYLESWSAYPGHDGKDGQGYFVVLNFSYGELENNMITAVTTLKPNGQALDADGILVVKVAGKDGVIAKDALTIKVAGKEFNIDLTGLTLGSAPKVEETDEDLASSLFKKPVTDLQSNIEIGEIDADNVIKVTGNCYQITGWTEFDPNVEKYQNGYYIALKLSIPGVAADSKIKFKAESATGGTDDAGWASMKNGDTIIWQLAGRYGGEIKNLIIEADGQEYTIDLQGINRLIDDYGQTAQFDEIAPYSVDAGFETDGGVGMVLESLY